MKYLLSITIIFILFSSCEESISPTSNDNFDRTLMVENWVDQFITPGYSIYLDEVRDLGVSLEIFQQSPDNESLKALRQDYIDALHSWQSVSMFEISEAEKLGLRSFTNTFPADTEQINHNIGKEGINLELPSTRTSQGFPALDYMLFEKTQSDEVIAKLSIERNSEYLKSLVSRIEYLATEVKDSWDANKRDEFSSNPESVDRMVNDFLFYYEKYVRAGKVGIPAGVFSGDPLPMHREAPYSSIYSRSLLAESLHAVQNFFNSENGLASYLAFMDKADVAAAINEHWDKASQLLNSLNPSLKLQIVEENDKMLEVYDELQKAVILLKVDMLQALSIQVDYVDADGD